MSAVVSVRERLVLPTYGVSPPEKNPAFFERRVYQGSSGKVYPVPFIDKVFDNAENKSYDSVRLENEYVRLVILPELGGRIYSGEDKTNHDYNFFYKNDVIKPALVGLAGPWLSGGVEFNWPQHHRPGTFMPTDVELVEDTDGTKIVWMSEHDPINRLKGMHGICIKPNSSLVELRVRLFNRTPFTQSFLWWANVAAKVHENYQSFFPTDVHFVADHACRAVSSFPEANNYYYGIDYHNRPGRNDLTRYSNIPVPTSYMITATKYDFFGGYDFDAKGGFVHVADRHISPGKKQWTWGNDKFGWAWDRELTDENGPYIELMAGVYTDNQPDFSYLLPCETKSFSTFWWPYKDIGPVQNANTRAAIRMVMRYKGLLDLGVAVPESIENARIVVTENETSIFETMVTVSPAEPWKHELSLIGTTIESLEMIVFDGDEVAITFRQIQPDMTPLVPASEPPFAKDIQTIEELYLVGEHLELYRHPSRYPEMYWSEALRRDPNDSRCNISMGRLALFRGQFKKASMFFTTAMTSLTRHHSNPATGEAHYYLGLSCKFQGKLEEAYQFLYKSTWNYAYKSCGYYELASIDVHKGDFKRALDHLNMADGDNNKVVVLKAIILRHLGNKETAATELNTLINRDRLDHWALFELGKIEGDYSNFLACCRNDAQTILDIAFDYSDCGLFGEAIDILELHMSHEIVQVAFPNPLERSQMTMYALSWMYHKSGDAKKSQLVLKKARLLDAEYFFASRIHEQIVLEWAISVEGSDSVAAFALGNYYFDRKRHEDAIRVWENGQQSNMKCATVSRNLGIAYWNVRRDGQAALNAFEHALSADPGDARVLFEFDQLCKKLGHDINERVEYLLNRKELVVTRDDCSVELANLLNETDQPEEALELLLSRRFHPWEGGEGQALKQYKTAHIRLGCKELESGNGEAALTHFQNAITVPHSLGEAYHPLQAKADIYYWTGRAYKLLGNDCEANEHFEKCTNEQGDFQSMAVTEHSELSYYRGLSLMELGKKDEAFALFASLKKYAEEQLSIRAKIDYFATSLPLLLVFEDDIDETKNSLMTRLISLADQGLRALV